MQTLGLNGIFHKVRLRDDRRDSQTDRHSHAPQCLRLLWERIVTIAHVARIEVRVWTHGGEIERVDAGLGQHEDTDAGGLSPDAIEIVPGRIVWGA